MKFGGLTWWRNNYGSILQAFALQEYINSFEGIEYEIINQFGKSITSADNLLNKLKTIGLRKTLQRAFWKVGIKGLRERNRKIQMFVNAHLKTSNISYSEETIYRTNSVYDGFVCGSDQIWNPGLVDIDSMYWLGFSDAGKVRIAYAPSIGVDNVDEVMAATIRKNLSRFDAISCRENQGTRLINAILGEDSCMTVVDPTLLAGRPFWDNLSKKRLIEEEYVFVYLLRGSKEQRKMIEVFAARENIKIVTIPFLEAEYTVWYDFKFGDIKYWDADPNDFVSLIRHAKYVFTDSFHSTVFSILYHIPFFIFPKVGKAQMNRITGLLDASGIENRIINVFDDISRLKESKINWKTVDLRLHEERIKSQVYLKNAFIRKSVGRI